MNCRLFAALVLLLVPSFALAQALPAGPGDWPQWRGPNRDGISLDQGLLKEWPAEGPSGLWQVDTRRRRLLVARDQRRPHLHARRS